MKTALPEALNLSAALTGEKVIFKGRGSGSGLGLSLWGARQLANDEAIRPDIIKIFCVIITEIQL